jgi:hypothetical protein
MYEHAVALRGCFGSYSDICFQTFLPLLSYKFSAALPVASALTLSAVFDASSESCDSSVPRKYFVQLVTEISRQLDSDQNDHESRLGFAESLCDILRTVYLLEQDHREEILGACSIENLETLVRSAMSSMASCLERRKSTTLRLHDKDVLDGDDLNEFNNRLQLEQNLLTQLVDSVGYILKVTKEHFFPIFENVVFPVLSPYLQDEYDIRARLSAICLFDDAVEHCGSEAANKFASHLAAAAIIGLDDTTNKGDEDLKSASIYGIAQISRKTNGDTLRPGAMRIVQQLVALINRPKEESENHVIYENAMSCLASLILIGNAPFRTSGFVKHEDFVNRFLSSLPLREDVDEAKFCHSELCRLLETGQVNLISHCESLVRIIGETLALVDEGEDIADTETCSRFAEILIYLNEQNTHGFGSMVSSLSNECQAAVFAALQNRVNAPNLVTP